MRKTRDGLDACAPPPRTTARTLRRARQAADSILGSVPLPYAHPRVGGWRYPLAQLAYHFEVDRLTKLIQRSVARASW